MTEELVKEFIKMICQSDLTANSLSIRNNKLSHINLPLYKYCAVCEDSKRTQDTIDYNIDNFENDVLYFQNPANFNDPFDCFLGFSQSQIVKDLLIQEIRKKHQYTPQIRQAIDSFFEYTENIQEIIDDNYDSVIEIIVTLEPIIRLPAYLIARFNLKIRFIYKGLLLGTGPIVDPGFQGRLSIPLHNLTENEYEIKGGESIIAMEFTKISPNKLWDTSRKDVEKSKIKSFTDATIDRDVFTYTNRALDKTPFIAITNSVPSIEHKFDIKVREFNKKIEFFNKTLEESESRTKKKIDRISIATIISIATLIVTLLIAIFTLLLPTWQAYDTLNDRISNPISNNELNLQIEELTDQIINLEDQLYQKNDDIQSLQYQIEELKKQLNELILQNENQTNRGDGNNE